MGSGGVFQELKRPGRQADHSTPFSAERKNVWSCTYISPHAIIACIVTTFNFILIFFLVKEREICFFDSKAWTLNGSLSK